MMRQVVLPSKRKSKLRWPASYEGNERLSVNPLVICPDGITVSQPAWFVNYIIAKINIPESDYNKIFVLKNAVAYLRDALARV